MRIPLERFEELGRKTPYLVNMRPAGKYLMEDFYYAGGLSGLLEGMRDLLDMDAMTCTGKTLGENIAGAKIHQPDVIRTPANPIQPEGGLVVLRGNLAPDGAVIKSNAADPRLLKHAGRAMVFDDYNDMAARIDDPNLDVDADSVLILRNAGPLGGPGMPEWGMLPIPKKLLDAGRARHGAHLGRAHERHQLRHLRPARRARVLRRRAAGAGEDRRHRRSSTWPRAGSTST